MQFFFFDCLDSLFSGCLAVSFLLHGRIFVWLLWTRQLERPKKNVRAARKLSVWAGQPEKTKRHENQQKGREREKKEIQGNQKKKKRQGRAARKKKTTGQPEKQSGKKKKTSEQPAGPAEKNNKVKKMSGNQKIICQGRAI